MDQSMIMNPWPHIHDLDTVKQLIESGTDINKKYDFDNTLLHDAASRGNIDIVKYLVESGANIDAIGHEGYTPLHLAILENAISYQHNNNVIFYLLENGASKEIRDQDGKTAVDWAVAHPSDNELAELVKSYEAVPTKGVHD
jgi:ankyrin repeat protein